MPATETQAHDSMSTTISVPEDLADELYERKGRGESYADVIRRLLEAETPATERRDTPTTDADKEREPPATPAESTKTLLDEIADETIPGSGEKLTARRKAFHAVVEYLREHGRATPADFQSDVYPEHTAYYTDADDPGRSWWKNAMYPALAELAERSDAVVKPDQSGIWRYVGEAEP